MALLDTCALLWLVSDPNQISGSAKQVLSQSGATLYVSALSAFEIGNLSNKKRVQLGSSPERWFDKAVTDYHLNHIPATWEIALASTQLPPIHADPIDRIIIASSLALGIPILSPDRQFPKYPGVQVIW
jgi:PIN domain nuclease of toxin-antitoxin system